MNIIEKSESIRAGLRKGFQDGTSKMAQRRCYGYDVGSGGELVINLDEVAIVRWIFERYLHGDSLGKNRICAGSEKHSLPLPASLSGIGRLSTNCYPMKNTTGRVLLQKTISTGTTQIKNDGILTRYVISDAHEPIISDEMFKLVQQEKMKRTNSPETGFSMQMLF